MGVDVVEVCLEACREAFALVAFRQIHAVGREVLQLGLALHGAHSLLFCRQQMQVSQPIGFFHSHFCFGRSSVERGAEGYVAMLVALVYQTVQDALCGEFHLFAFLRKVAGDVCFYRCRRAFRLASEVEQMP